MKKKGILLGVISVLSVVGLSSCGGSDNKSINYGVSTLDMLTQLKDCSNFEMDIYNTKVGDKGSIILNDNYYIDEINSYGYILDSNKGIYKFDVSSEGEIVGNEIVKEKTDSKNVKLTDLVNSFSSFDTTALDEEDNKVSIKDKTNRQAFLSLIGEDLTNYQLISSLDASYDKDKKELTFNLKYNDKNNSYVDVTVSNFNNAKSTFVEKYIKNGGTYYTPTKEMVEVRDLFKTNNFSRYIYGTDGTSKIGQEYFTQDYWCTNYFETTTVAYNVGYVSLIDKVYEGVSLSNGSYYFAPYSDPTQEVVVMLAGTAFQETDMPTIMNYPQYMELFSYYNLFNYNEDYQMYFSNDYSVAYSMYKNFGVDQANYSSVTLAGSGFNFVKENNEYIATFYLVGSFDGTIGYLSFEFRDFGKTSHPGLEKFLAKLTVQSN